MTNVLILLESNEVVVGRPNNRLEGLLGVVDGISLLDLQARREARGRIVTGLVGTCYVCKRKGRYARECEFKDLYHLVHDRLGEAIEKRQANKKKRKTEKGHT